MYKNQYDARKKSRSAIFILLFGSFFIVFAMLIVVPASNAAELNPVENMSPPQSEPSMSHLPERATLVQEDKKTPHEINNAKSKPSWWNWLTNASNKPANFHFIDILELLN